MSITKSPTRGKNDNYYEQTEYEVKIPNNQTTATPGMKQTYASVTHKKNLNILSLDFTIKNGFNISPSYIGSFCQERLGLVKEEINGVHRYGINQDRSAGYIKIKTKNDFQVNKRFERFAIEIE